MYLTFLILELQSFFQQKIHNDNNQVDEIKQTSQETRLGIAEKLSCVRGCTLLA